MPLFGWSKKNDPEDLPDDAAEEEEVPGPDDEDDPGEDGWAEAADGEEYEQDEDEDDDWGDEWLRALPSDTVPMGESVLLHTRGLRPPVEVPTFFEAILAECHGVADLETHATQVALRMGIREPGIRDSIRNLLDDLHQKGLLISETELLSHVRDAAESERAEVATLAIPTRDRPELLRACVESFAANRRAHGRTYDLLVVDDSPDPGMRNRYGETLAALGDEWPVWYAGPEEKSRFIRALKEAGEGRFTPSSVDFLLANPHACDRTTGANRNASLLHTMGDLMLTVDDDMRVPAARSPDFEPGLRLTAAHDSTEFYFFFSRDEALEAAEFQDVDVVALHEELLGRSLASCIADTPLDELDWHEMGDACLEALLSNQGRVLLTATGVVGDSGQSGTSYYLYPRPGHSFQRLLESVDYQATRLTREVIRAAESATISSGTQFMGGFAGIDNRALVPPFFPVQRNQDGGYARTLRRVVPGGMIGTLPWVVAHEPPGTRAQTEDELFASALGVNTPDVIQSLLPRGGGSAHRYDAEVRLDMLGRHYQDVGSLDLPAFEQYLKEALWATRGDSASILTVQVSHVDDAPEAWFDDIERIVHELQDRMLGDDFAVPSDLAQGRSREEALELTRRLVADWGTLLREWSAIRRACLELRDQGIRLGRPLGA